jgi:hypothetical protein
MARLGRTRGQRRNHDVRAIRSGPAVQTSPQLTQRRTTKSYFSTGWPSPIRTLLVQLEVGDQTRPPFTGQKLIQIADHLLGVLA